MQEVVSIKGPAIEPVKFRLYGLVGTFAVAGPDAKVVKYFQTLASGSEGAAGNSAHLLNELKPMRERVDADSIPDLSVILQRELDDDRIARDLVPYLAGRDARVGFFPAVMAALMPKGFVAGKGGSYPQPESRNEKTEYGDFWTVTTLSVGDKRSALAVLEINPNLTDIVVLDGQHRANAFRYMAGKFDQALGNSAYAPLYEVAGAPPADFSAELPVTIVWFESQDGEIDPAVVSRRLFVDVNQHAKQVELSRQILLNDRQPSQVLTVLTYKRFAASGFSVCRLSLLHTGFDSTSDSRCKLTLFVPEELWSALAFFATGKDDYHDIRPSNSKRFAPSLQKNFELLSSLIGCDDVAVLRQLDETGRAEIRAVRDAMSQVISEPLAEFLGSNPLVKAHVDATRRTDERVRRENSFSLNDVWRTVFLGGEGLYAAYRARERKATDGREGENPFKDRMDKIEEWFCEERAEACGESAGGVDRVNAAFRTFGTKANLVGLLMAVSVAATERSWRKPFTEVGTRLEQLSARQFVGLLTDYREALGRKLEGADWPMMMRIYLRALQSKDSDVGFFAQRVDINPDVMSVERDVHSRLKRWLEASPRELPREEMREGWIREAIGSLRARLASSGLTEIVSEEVLAARASQLLEKEVATRSATELEETDTNGYDDESEG
jgi:hypothetical protein